MNLLIQDAGRYYRQLFGEPEYVVRSPGRINVIGEHTDYHEGFVLPASIDNAMYVSVGRRNDQQVSLYAVDFQEQHSFELSVMQQRPAHWSNYVRGVVAVLQEAGYVPGGFNAVVRGDIPVGAGLSSSAALECALLFALNELFGWKISRDKMVLMAQKAENDFVGVQCGRMDQYASLFGKAQHLIQLDCRTMESQYIPWNATEVELLLLDTKVKHALADSAYNERRRESEAGVALLQEWYPHIQSLRDVTTAMVEKHLADAPANIFQRCSYVVAENQRVLDTCAALAQNDFETVGKKMFETHRGLSHQYAVSCAELDTLVAVARQSPNVLGARMMGGGFGGCTINLIKKGTASWFIDRANEAYLEKYGTFLEAYPVSIADGTSLVPF